MPPSGGDEVPDIDRTCLCQLKWGLRCRRPRRGVGDRSRSPRWRRGAAAPSAQESWSGRSGAHARCVVEQLRDERPRSFSQVCDAAGEEVFRAARASGHGRGPHAGGRVSSDSVASQTSRTAHARSQASGGAEAHRGQGEARRRRTARSAAKRARVTARGAALALHVEPPRSIRAAPRGALDLRASAALDGVLSCVCARRGARSASRESRRQGRPATWR